MPHEQLMPRLDPDFLSDGRSPARREKEHNGGWLCSVIVRVAAKANRADLDRTTSLPAEITVVQA